MTNLENPGQKKQFFFGVCGGCRSEPGSRPVPYSQELMEKEARVRGLLAAYDVADWKPILLALPVALNINDTAHR